MMTRIDDLAKGRGLTSHDGPKYGIAKSAHSTPDPDDPGPENDPIPEEVPQPNPVPVREPDPIPHQVPIRTAYRC